MNSAKEGFVKKCMENFCKLPISEKRLDAIESYLLGEADITVLDGYELIDVYATDEAAFKQQMTKCIYNLKDIEMAERLFYIYFSLVQSFTFRWVEYREYIMDLSKNHEMDRAKLVAFYTPSLSNDTANMRGYKIQKLVEVSKKDPAILQKAIEYQEGQKYSNSTLLLTAVYLLCKYEDKLQPLQAEDKTQKSGLLASLGKVFQLKEGVIYDDTDSEKVKHLEKNLAGALPNLLDLQNTGFSFEELVAEAKKEKMSAGFLYKMSKGVCKNPELMKLIGGLAYLSCKADLFCFNIMKICFAVDPAVTLDAITYVTRDLRVGRIDATRYGEDFDLLFEIPSEVFIKWAMKERCAAIVERQSYRNEEMIIGILEKSDYAQYQFLMPIIRRTNPKLYEKINSLDHTASEQDREAIALKIVERNTASQVFVDYLVGRTKVDTLYPVLPQIGSSYMYRQEQEIDTYLMKMKDEIFAAKAGIYMALRAPGNVGKKFFPQSYNDATLDTNKVQELFDLMEKEGLLLKYQVNFTSNLMDEIYNEKRKEAWGSFFKEHYGAMLQTNRDELLAAFAESNATGRILALKILFVQKEDYKKEILSYCADTTKSVRLILLPFLIEQTDWEQEIIQMLSEKKQALREMALRVLMAWNDGKGTYNEVLSEAMAKEKNAKMIELFGTALQGVAPVLANGGTKTVVDLVQDAHKGGKKRQLSWIYDNGHFSEVHMADGTNAEEEYLQAICLYYASMDKCGINATAKILAEQLNQEELAVYANEVFDVWMADGAVAKRKWVLYYASIHGGSVIVDRLKAQMLEWAQNMRGSIAAEAVGALALNPTPQALLVVDGISRKYKFKQVKDAAGRALQFAAEQLGLSTEELADRIVPDLGFDEKMEKIFDYGERSFTVTISPELEILVKDETGKKLKNLPAPGKKDDEEQAKKAYDEFKQLKKQMKATVTGQKMRLEMALSTGRQWKSEDWKNLFVKNPIMHQFAIGLIWGSYQDGKLLQSFRYMEDGSFNTEEEDEYTLPKDAVIGLVHPIELTKESIAAWKEQLEDYEIKQPIEQLDRQVFYMTEEEKNAKTMERFGGLMINDLSLTGKLTNLGWYRGSVLDAGGFYDFYREDATLGMGVELNFSGSFVGGGYEEDVTIYDVRFYSIGVVKRGSYVYDEVDDNKSLLLKEVPERYFSEIVYQLSKITASCETRDENWKKQRN